MIKGVLFDKDGTLMQFAPFWIPVVKAAAEQMLKDKGMPLSLADAMMDCLEADKGIAGLLCYGTYGSYAKRFSAVLGVSVTGQEVAMEVQKSMEKGIIVPTCENLKEVIQALKEQGLFLAVVTTDNLPMTELCLKELGIAECITAVYADDGIHPPKPDPYVIQDICVQYGFAPAELCMVGDTLNDVRFAKNGGVQFMGVAQTEEEKRTLLEECGCVVPDVSHIFEVIERDSDRK